MPIITDPEISIVSQILQQGVKTRADAQKAMDAADQLLTAVQHAAEKRAKTAEDPGIHNQLAEVLTPIIAELRQVARLVEDTWE